MAGWSWAQGRLGVAGLALAIAGRVLATSPAIVEWHRESVFPRVATMLQFISGGATVTLGEPFAALIAGLALLVALQKRMRAAGLVAFGAGLFTFAFYASWGLAYHYPPLGMRLAPLPQASEAAQLERLVASAELVARRLARAFEASTPLDVPGREFLAVVNRGLAEGYSRLPGSIEASPIRGVKFGPVKFSRASFALSRLQLSGYFFPWTGEAQINRDMPRSLWARVAAHEMAHQRGFARENEATVIGLLACLSSGEPRVRYGGALGLFAALDREVAQADPAGSRGLWLSLPAEVVAEFRAETAFWKANEGAAGAVSERVNDAYLKAQGVGSGVASYSETTRLILQAIATPGLGIDSWLAIRESEGAPR